MKRILGLIVLAAPMLLWAQQEPGATAPSVSSLSTNLTVRNQAPTYSDIYCAGFVTKENLPKANFVAGGLHTPHTTKFGSRDIVYLEGPGYAVGNRYTVLRKVTNPNRYEMFPGQHSLLSRSGNEYAEIGRVVITDLDKNSAVGSVEFSCQPMVPGDILVKFEEKQMIQYKNTTTPFKRYAPYSGVAGRIIDGKEFDQVLGTGQKVYVNIGANKGLKPGDYLRITRNYRPSEMDPIDELSLKPPSSEDTSKDPAKVSKHDLNNLPYRGIGEMIVISVTPETATGMITLALEDIQVGDVVEVPAAQ